MTVRALAEGEQLVTLRKGGIRETGKHFKLEHDRFFLYPTFDHQQNDLVRESHQPELRRALEEGVWADGEPPVEALTQDGGIAQPERVRIRAWAEVAAHVTVTDPRTVDALSPYYVWTTDYAEKRLAWKRRHPLHVLLLRTYRIPRPVTVKVKDAYGGLPVLVRDPARPALRGHAGPLGRRVRARRRGDPRDRRRRRAPPASRRWSSAKCPCSGARRGPLRGHRRRRRRRRCPRRRPLRALARRRGGRRRPDVGAAPDRPAARPAPARRDHRRRGAQRHGRPRRPDTATAAGGIPFAESHMARPPGRADGARRPEPRPRPRSAPG